jgi:thiol:disulfide interchange protein DsbC
MKKHLTAALLPLLFAAATAHAGETEIRKNVEAWLGNDAKVDSVRPINVSGLYEIQANGEVFYSDEKADNVIIGKIIDVKTKKNLTEAAQRQLGKIKFSDLPLDLAMKQVRGNGKRVIATFEDPNCGYCKALEKDMSGLTDVTIYTFLYPILSPDSAAKSKTVWCSADRVKTWTDWMLNGAAPAEAKCDDNTVDKVVALGQKLKVGGTPTIFLADGMRIVGVIPAAELEQVIGAVN